MAQQQSAGSVCRRPRGFTLTELLVVMSIICLMMSLLLPSLTHAQKQGEQIHCLANQHQLILAWLQYAIDHDDKLCPSEPYGIDSNDTTGLPQSYVSRLRPYVQMKEVFRCKSAGEITLGEGIGPSAWNNSYGLSNTMGGQLRDGVEPFLALHMVSRPSERMVLVDKEPECSDCFWPLLRNGKQWTWRPWPWYGPGSLQGMTGRHNNGCNMSFADGHGEYTLWKDPRTRKVIKGLIADPNDAVGCGADAGLQIKACSHVSTAEVRLVLRYECGQTVPVQRQGQRSDCRSVGSRPRRRACRV